MDTLARPYPRRRLSLYGIAAASVILAIEPVQWLIETWQDPSYETSGWLYLAVLAALILWSATSPRKAGEGHAYKAAAILLVIAALLRLVSQVSAINIIGGMALALDVFALLAWFGMGERTRSVSPLWLSVLFLFTLPVERVAQRILGYPMQEASALGACQMLAPFFTDLVCDGVRLRVEGQDVLVDLPCSGTASLMVSLALIVALNAVFRPRFRYAAAMIALTLVLAVIGNALRISLLAMGLVHAPLTGIDVMAAPTHDIIGYTTLALSLAPVVWLYRASPGGAAAATAMPTVPWFRLSWSLPRRALPYLSAGFAVLALIIVSLPRQALDVSRELAGVALPHALNGAIKQPQPLSERERTYFEQFGGTAQKASYGPLAMTVVQTTSPLRHLHTPEDCLRGLGYRVTFLGTRFEPVPTSIYKAEDREGRAWKVAVTFTASNGFATSNVAEAIWQWLRNPQTEWRSVQRITPWTLSDHTRDEFERAAVAALDLPHTSTLQNPWKPS